MYQPVKRGRLYEQIVLQIESQILEGTLKANDRLPPERELAEQFGVSRTAVREAVKALTQRGLVAVYPGRGTFVIDRTAQALQHSIGLAARIGQAGGGLSELMEVREILEPEIAGMAALRADAEHIDRMELAVAAMDAALDDADAFIEADLEFHLALAEGSQNQLIPKLINSIIDVLREQRKWIFGVDGGPERGQFHHKKILAAVRDGDECAAREAMRAHLAQVRDDSTLGPGGAGPDRSPLADQFNPGRE